jgi:hypothetical protein
MSWTGPLQTYPKLAAHVVRGLRAAHFETSRRRQREAGGVRKAGRRGRGAPLRGTGQKLVAEAAALMVLVDLGGDAGASRGAGVELLPRSPELSPPRQGISAWWMSGSILAVTAMSSPKISPRLRRVWCR